MFPIPWILIVYFLFIWMMFGLVAAFCSGVAMRFLLREDRSQSLTDVMLGSVGAIAGVLISGWASLRTYNAGVHRYLLWDANGRLIDWRTFLAENRILVVVVCAVFLVTLWHVTPLICRRIKLRRR
jgi:uncharacterized membrane protein YeaQ/YmgE (transglycosylase-associated protein family)